jgi:hypothetical protein
LNPFGPLKTRNLLILLSWENAQNAKRAPFGHALGTRKDDQSGSWVAGWSHALPSSTPTPRISLFTAAATWQRPPSISNLMSLSSAAGKISPELEGEVPDVRTVGARLSTGFPRLFVITVFRTPLLKERVNNRL